MESTDTKYSDVVLAITNDELKRSELVTIWKLLTNELQICTPSEMARIKNKTPQGIRKSKKYEKYNMGGQIVVIE